MTKHWTDRFDDIKIEATICGDKGQASIANFLLKAIKPTFKAFFTEELKAARSQLLDEMLFYCDHSENEQGRLLVEKFKNK